ncbi:MAG: DUF1559 domain-containing protein [Pirellulales bacterium]|nr:DUF1559 domain-containing protein [Pirellulales bacterium]
MNVHGCVVGKTRRGKIVRNHLRSGFTLVELLVVIAIIGILIALLLPAVQAAREAARRISCNNNLKQVALAIHTYHDGHNRLPMVTPYSDVDTRGPGGVWAALILPQLGHQPTYDMFDFNYSMGNSVNAEAVKTVISSYICPSAQRASRPVFDDRAEASFSINPHVALGMWYPLSMGPTQPDTCHYCPVSPPSYCCQGYNYGTANPPNNSTGMFGRHPDGFRLSDVTDGLSHTFMAGEHLPRQCVYISAYAPNFSIAGTQIPLNTFEICLKPPGCHARACGFKSDHPGGAQFAMGDGSVHFIKESIDYRLYNGLGTRNGGEQVSVEEQ